MSQAPAVHPPTRRRRKGLLATVAIVVVLAVGLPAAYRYLLVDDLAEAIFEADRLDPGWRLADIEAARAKIPDERNSVFVMDKVYRAITPSEATSRRLIEGLHGLPPNAPLPPQTVPELRKYVMAAGNARTEALRLKDFPAGRYPPSLGYLRGQGFWAGRDLNQPLRVGDFVYLLTVLAIHEGAHATVKDALGASFNTARAVGDEPNVMGQLVYDANIRRALGTLNRALVQGKWTTAELRSLHELLECALNEPRLLWGIRGERAFVIATQEATADGRLPRLAVSRAGWRAWMPGWMVGAQALKQAKVLRALNDQVVVSRLPVEQQLPAASKLIATQQADAHTSEVSNGFGVLVRELVESQAEMRCALVGVAAQRYRQEHGTWPESPATLVQDNYLKQVPLNPFNGQALTYRRLPDGIEVHAVAPNDPAAPIPTGPTAIFRLWDTTAKPLPAP